MQAIRKYGGNLAAVGRKFGVTRQAVHEYVSTREELRQAVLDCREGMKDEAESVLHKAVKKGQPWAVCFYLKCQAKDRGYVERQEVEQTATTRLVIEEEVTGGDHLPDGPPAPEAVPLPP